MWGSGRVAEVMLAAVVAATSAAATTEVATVKTVKVSSISLSASRKDIREFFSVSGPIVHIEMRSESKKTQIAYVTFKDTRGADTAMLLSGATIIDLPVSVILTENYQLPPGAHKLTTSGRKLLKHSNPIFDFPSPPFPPNTPPPLPPAPVPTVIVQDEKKPLYKEDYFGQ